MTDKLVPVADDEPDAASGCPHCGSAETVELHSPDERQAITVCAGCGAE